MKADTALSGKKNRHPVTYILISALVLGLLVASFLPESWSRTNGPLSPLVRLMVSIVPSIDTFVSVSLFPGVTETFLSLMWTLVPFMTILFLRFNKPVPLDKMTTIKRKWEFSIGLILVWIGGVVVPFVGIPTTQNDLIGSGLSSIVLRNVSQSRVWLGALGSLSCAVCALLLSGTVSFVRNFHRLYLGNP